MTLDDSADAHAFLRGGGEMGARMRAMDWSSTAVGPVESWPQSLRSTLSLLLPSRAQEVLFWGPEFVVFYNDAYRPVFGAKHPQALGRPGTSSFTVIFGSRTLEANGERFREAMRRALAPLRGDRHIAHIMSPVDVPPLVAATLVSADNHHALAAEVTRRGTPCGPRGSRAARRRCPA